MLETIVILESFLAVITMVDGGWSVVYHCSRSGGIQVFVIVAEYNREGFTINR